MLKSNRPPLLSTCSALKMALVLHEPRRQRKKREMSKQSMREEPSSSFPRSTLLTAVVADRPPNGRSADVSQPRRRAKSSQMRTCRWRGSAVVPLPARPPSLVHLSDKRLASAWLSSCSFLHTSPQAILASIKPCIALSRASSALSTAELASFSFSCNVFSFGISPPSHRSIGRARGKRFILDEAAKRGIICAL